MAAAAWLNPAGGLRYHARALLAGQKWAAFREDLSAWLAGFEPSSGRALLVGPSAGYCIPDAFLQRFQTFTVLDPDPIARLLLARRLRRLGARELRIERADWLIAPLLERTPGLVELLAADPELCVIFGNVLGQTSFLVEDAQFEQFKQAFREQVVPLLAGRARLSFHDRLSGGVAPSFRAPFEAPARLDDAAVLRELYRVEQAPPGSELFDHRSDGFFPGAQPHSYFAWQIARRQYHLIEAVRSR